MADLRDGISDRPDQGVELAVHGVTGLAAAATAPLSVFLLGLRLDVAMSGTDYLHVYVVPFLSVAIAVFGARVIHGISMEVAKARQMGSYQLLERLGQGGMGEVWRAKHRFLQRPAALKLIRREALGADGDTVNAAAPLKRFVHSHAEQFSLGPIRWIAQQEGRQTGPAERFRLGRLDPT